VSNPPDKIIRLAEEKEEQEEMVKLKTKRK
jgi:hypothetical protein